MNVRFKASFARDLRDLKDKALRERIKELIASVEAAQSLAEVLTLRICGVVAGTIASE